MIEIRKLTQEEFEKRLYDLNKNIEVIGKYQNNSTKVICKCKICHDEWSPLPANLFKGHGCPSCANNKRYSTEEFIIKLNEVNTDIELLDEYKSIFEKVHIKYKSCGHECFQAPHDLLQGASCTICSGKNKTTESFKKYISKINPQVTILSPYTKMKDKITIKGEKPTPLGVGWIA